MSAALPEDRRGGERDPHPAPRPRRPPVFHVFEEIYRRALAAPVDAPDSPRPAADG